MVIYYPLELYRGHVPARCSAQQIRACTYTMPTNTPQLRTPPRGPVRCCSQGFKHVCKSAITHSHTAVVNTSCGHRDSIPKHTDGVCPVPLPSFVRLAASHRFHNACCLSKICLTHMVPLACGCLLCQYTSTDIERRPIHPGNKYIRLMVLTSKTIIQIR